MVFSLNRALFKGVTIKLIIHEAKREMKQVYNNHIELKIKIPKHFVGLIDGLANSNGSFSRSEAISRILKRFFKDLNKTVIQEGESNYFFSPKKIGGTKRKSGEV